MTKTLRRLVPRDDDRAYAMQSRFEIDELIQSAQPVPFAFDVPPTRSRPLQGTGVYLRTDFWSRITSGGSYGHTCYVAKELASRADRFVCLLANRFPLLDRLGVRQVVTVPPAQHGTEGNIIRGTSHYYPMLKAAFEAVRPAYLYERLVLGNYAGARLSRELGIPYIVEYNGSEVSMFRSFEGKQYAYETLYLKAEQVAFRQATMISVMSQIVKDSLVDRGIDAGKILVNPNGADLDAYRPVGGADRESLRRELHLSPTACVVGFTGTFGGWHGIDVLAAAIPRICAAAPASSSCSSATADSAPRHRRDRRAPACTSAWSASAACRRTKARGCWARATSSSRRTTRTWSTAASSDRRPSCSSTWRWAAASWRRDWSRSAKCCRRRSTPWRCTPTPRSATRARCCASPDRSTSSSTAWRSSPISPRFAVSSARNARAAVDATTRGRGMSTGCGPMRRRSARSRRSRSPARCRPATPTRTRCSTSGTTIPADRTTSPRRRAHTLEWFVKTEAHRYGDYAPWMPEVMEFAQHAGEDVLEIGGGMGTDLAQFAAHGARVTDVDLSGGHLELAQENFELRGLAGRVRAPRRRIAAVSRRLVRSRLQQRRAAPHAEHRARRRRDPTAC